MSIPFVAQLRSRPDIIRLGTSGEPVITVRVQLAERWDTIRVDAPADTAVSVVKQRALEALAPDAPRPEEYVTKLNGWQVLDEQCTLAAAGAVSGSTLLLHSRRRHPVR
ncbi:MAG: hypothetical protein U0132_08050 [Gemmatimonadaceae bacterium]